MKEFETLKLPKARERKPTKRRLARDFVRNSAKGFARKQGGALVRYVENEATKVVGQSGEFRKADLVAEILREARVVQLPMGTAEVIAEKVAEVTARWMKRRGAVTMSDLNRQVAKEMQKYSADLAYIYQNRGKII